MHLGPTHEKERRLLMAHLLNITYEQVFLANPNAEDIPGFNELWQKRLEGAPLARLTGKQIFRDLVFDLSPDVLEPRSDSELILETLQQGDLPPAPHILDLGVGSGCLLISALIEWPLASGVGVDISLEALTIARQNGQKHGVNSRATWLQSNWLNDVPAQQFDVIISNPPYIGTHEPLDDDVKLYDPHLALYAGIDGLDCYRAILANLKPYCHDQTKCLFEIGYQQREAMIQLLEAWHIHDIHLDDSGHPRVIVFGL